MTIKKILLTILAFILAFAAIVLVNITGSMVLEKVMPGSLDADGMPVTTTSQILFLVMVFIAGATGAFVVVFLAPVRPVLYVVIYTVLILAIDIHAAVTLRGILPLWNLIAIVVIVPPQAWVGAVAGLRVRKQWRSQEVNTLRDATFSES